MSREVKQMVTKYYVQDGTPVPYSMTLMRETDGKTESFAGRLSPEAKKVVDDALDAKGMVVWKRDGAYFFYERATCALGSQ